jgi:DNA ligase D-like protein (predicted 3'-phosphoesterase)
MNLKKYQEKRKFKSTPEPGGTKKAKKKYKNIFVIQKHAATNLHYDFRLEITGVLVSWAIPKGLSLDPKTKRLAIRTEDHPLEYADFEGAIPENQYGGGTVIVWDQGKYENQLNDNMTDALRNGKLNVWLNGNKIQGGYHLIKTQMNQQNKEQWLIMKVDDEKADARRKPTSTQPKSVISNKTIEQMNNKHE